MRATCAKCMAAHQGLALVCSCVSNKTLWLRKFVASWHWHFNGGSWAAFMWAKAGWKQPCCSPNGTCGGIHRALPRWRGPICKVKMAVWLLVGWFQTVRKANQTASTAALAMRGVFVCASNSSRSQPTTSVPGRCHLVMC